MKGIKNFLIAALVVFSVWCISGCTEKTKMNMVSDTITRIVIYPSSGGGSETYLFEFESSGKVLIEKGTRSGVDITQESYMIKDDKYEFESEAIDLSVSEREEITSLIKEICDKSNANNYEQVYDSWDILILYKGRIVQQNCFHSGLPEITDLLNKLSKISPIKIILRGFA